MLALALSTTSVSRNRRRPRRAWAARPLAASSAPAGPCRWSRPWSTPRSKLALAAPSAPAGPCRGFPAEGRERRGVLAAPAAPAGPGWDALAVRVEMARDLAAPSAPAGPRLDLPIEPAPQRARRGAVGPQQVVEPAREDHLAPAVAGAGADVDHPVGGADDGGVVLDHEHRVALVAQAAQHGDEVVDVARMEPDGRLVEDVDEVDEVAVELARHLDPLALAARERRHPAVERQVADADVDQVPERPPHPRDEGLDDLADRCVVVVAGEVPERPVQLRQLALDEAADGPAAGQLHRQRGGVQPGAAAIRAGPLAEQPPVRLPRHLRNLVLVLVDVQPLELAGHPVEGPFVGLALVHLPDEQAVGPEQPPHLGLAEPPERLVRRDHPGADDLAPVPLADGVARVPDGALLDAPVAVEQRVDVDADALAQALARRAHAVGMVEREAVRPADVRPPATREQHPQVGVDLGDGAHGAAAARPEALLVDDDAGRDVPDDVDRGARELGQAAAGIGAEGLDELALRLGADGVEDERRLPAAAHAGEGDEAVLGNVDVDALQVVGPGAPNLDVGHVRRSSPANRRRRSAAPAKLPKRPRDRAAASAWRPNQSSGSPRRSTAQTPACQSSPSAPAPSQPPRIRSVLRRRLLAGVRSYPLDSRRVEDAMDRGTGSLHRRSFAPA